MCVCVCLCDVVELSFTFLCIDKLHVGALEKFIHKIILKTKIGRGGEGRV